MLQPRPNGRVFGAAVWGRRARRGEACLALPLESVVEAAVGGAVAVEGEFEDVVEGLDIVGPVEVERDAARRQAEGRAATEFP